MPPAAAASAAEAMVSRYSKPGSPSAARMSTRPGQRIAPSCLDDRGAVRTAKVGAEIGDDAVAHQQIAVGVNAGRRIEQADVEEEGVRVMRLGQKCSPSP